MQKSLYTLFLLGVFGLFAFPFTVSADASYSFCDYTNTTTAFGTVSPSINCATNGTTLTEDKTLYGFQINVATLPTGGFFYSSFEANNDACRSLPLVASLGATNIVLPTPLEYSTGDIVNVAFYNNAICTSGSDMTEYYTNNTYNMYKVFYWNPITYSAQTFWLTGFTTESMFTSSTTLNIDSGFNFGGLSTTTVQTFCDKNMPYDNSSIIQATLTYIPNGLCKVGAFLVIPTSESLNQFSNLSSTTKSHFPFSYINSVATTWTGLTASSSLNSPSYQYGLNNLGIGSTSAIGNILPTFTVFSASTTKTYFPSGTFDILKSLASIAIILTLIGDIFFTSRNMLKKN